MIMMIMIMTLGMYGKTIRVKIEQAMKLFQLNTILALVVFSFSGTGALGQETVPERERACINCARVLVRI